MCFLILLTAALCTVRKSCCSFNLFRTSAKADVYSPLMDLPPKDTVKLDRVKIE